MSDSGGSQGDDLEARARKSNSTLQSLIDAVGSLLAASRELLGRLQGYLPKEAPSGQNAAPEGDGPPELQGDKPFDVQENVAGPAPKSPKQHPACL